MDFIPKKSIFGKPVRRQEEPYSRRSKSPIFSFANTLTLANGERELFDFENDNAATVKYNNATFNNLRVSNSSSSDILIYPNQRTESPIIIASGTSEVMDRELFGAVHSLLIENIGLSSITAAQIRFIVWNDTTTAKEIISRAHEFLLDERKDPFSGIKEFLETSKKGAF